MEPEVSEAEVIEGPKPTGRQSEIDLTGSLMPWKNGQPVLLSVPGSTSFYLPLFSRGEQLESIMSRANTSYESIKQVSDGRDFLSSIPNDIKVMVNPYFTPEGRLRWTEVLRG